MASHPLWTLTSGTSYPARALPEVTHLPTLKPYHVGPELTDGLRVSQSRAQMRAAGWRETGALHFRMTHKEDPGPRVGSRLIPLIAGGLVLLAACAPTGSAAPSRTVVPRHATAPTATPHPFHPAAGAPLPANRIVAVYGIVYGYESNGFASSLAMLRGFLTQLTDLSRQFAALDPTHPVKRAVDLVVNPLKPCSQYPRWCSRFPDASTMQAYTSFCRHHHLLLFFDLQLGTEPVQDAIMKHLLPYLEEYPFTELALDTEFHFPNTPAGYAEAQNYPCCLGWMDAGEINWAADELATISRQYRLPRKVLVIHQWDPSVIHRKNQIRLNPNVSIVVQSDGWGATSYKVGNYASFVQQSMVEYGGYKLFLSHDGDTQFDIPLQTPQQVLQLFPQPLFISYQ